MKKFIFLFAAITSSVLSTRAQSLYFPPLTGNSWDTTSPASLGWCTDKIPDLYNYLQQRNSKAFLVLKDGKIVLEKYFGTFTADSAWYWASAGKSLTAFLIGIAKQEGKLRLEDTSSKYLGKGWTSCPPEKEALITVQHQLSMTSGLDDGVPDHYCTLDTCLKYKADAGTRWAYHNGPYTLLHQVLESATGSNANAWFNAKMRTQTGMTGLFIQQGYNNLFLSKPRSMARFGLLMLGRGKWNNTTILNDTAYFRQMINSSQTLNRSYGYLWWLNGKSNFMLPGLQFVFSGSLCPAAPADMYAAMGKNGQFLNVVPSQNLLVIRMGNSPSGSEVPNLFNDTIWQKLNAVMCQSTSSFQPEAESPEIWPVPAAEEIHIRISGSESFHVVCTDISGKGIFESSHKNTIATLSTGHLENGTYFLRICDAQGRNFHRQIRILRD